MTGGVAGLAALVANAVLRPLPAEAAGSLVLGASALTNDAGTASTALKSTNAYETLFASANSGGAGLSGHSDYGRGVIGHGSTAGVYGESFASDGIGVHGLKSSTTGPAVKGEILYPSNGYAAVFGVTGGTGPAVYGEGLASGNGTSGVARGTGSGVYGQSDNGRGGQFRGKKAQIRLEPATTTTHPSSGDAGDIYLDKSKRLWLCKGGTTWVRIV